MATRRTDFEMFQGNTKDLEIPVKDDAGVVVPIDGAFIKWELFHSSWKREDPRQPLLKKTNGSGDEGAIITDAAGGVFTVYLNPEDTVALKGKFYHEAEIVYADGAVETVLTGVVVIRPKANVTGESG